MDIELKKFLKDYYEPKSAVTNTKSTTGVDELQQSFCRRLVIARLMAPMTQQQLAESIGTTQSAIARIETGNCNPGLHTILKVCARLKLELSLQQQI